MPLMDSIAGTRLFLLSPQTALHWLAASPRRESCQRVWYSDHGEKTRNAGVRITYGDVGHWRGFKERFGRGLALYALRRVSSIYPSRWLRVRETIWLVMIQTRPTALYIHRLSSRGCVYQQKKELLFPPCLRNEVASVLTANPSDFFSDRITHLTTRDGLWLEIDDPVADIAEGPMDIVRTFQQTVVLRNTDGYIKCVSWLAIVRNGLPQILRRMHKLVQLPQLFIWHLSMTPRWARDKTGCRCLPFRTLWDPISFRRNQHHGFLGVRQGTFSIVLRSPLCVQDLLLLYGAGILKLREKQRF